MELAKTYTPSEIESKWYKVWEDNGYFKPTLENDKPNFCIQLPPPNVTGTLHMGHAFQQTIMDILTRYHRMRGYNTLWQAGTDHAGIATQLVVERQLEQEGLTRHDLGREQFMQRVWQWKQYSGSTITQQMRRIGASCDWSRERFTLDEGLSTAVTEVFVSLYAQGLIYRGKRLVNWDIQLQTAVSDLEVVAVEEDGHLWHISYPLSGDSGETVVVATTRPETLLGDVAVAVNPHDERYQHLIGKTLVLPLVGREIPLVADDYVTADFGTGCVKITPAHDFNDYALAKRHDLAMINIMTLDGHINANAPAAYCGMERFAARKQIVADLSAQGFLVATKAHKLMVPRGDRTNVIIEPMLTDQWFMQMDKLAARGLELVDSGQIRFVPDNWKKTYDQWLMNIQDWCISRQLWWGHRIPAYFDANGRVYVAKDRQQAEEQAGHAQLTQDNDVLDTWFSSALWCFSTLGWPQETQYLNTFLPSSVLVTGFDIIFFWVARMIMLTDAFTGKVPFKDIYINGLIMDAHGQKMSKSKGNIIDPLDIIDGISLEDLVVKRSANLLNPKQATLIAKQTRKDYPEGFLPFGADALRFALASAATQARYVNFDLKRIEGSRNFCNKLFNACKFVLSNVSKHGDLIGQTTSATFIDDWIKLELVNSIQVIEEAIATYRFDLAAQQIYEFVWNQVCDWYLELAKVNLQSPLIAVRAATMTTLVAVMEALLRLIHPFMPFISEELWQVIAPLAAKTESATIMLAKYPQVSDYGTLSGAALPQMAALKQIISSIRNLRAEMNLPPALKVPLLIETNAEAEFTEFNPYLLSLARVSKVELVSCLPSAANAPIAVTHNARLMLEVEINVADERLRLTKQLEKSVAEAVKIQAKLDNGSYLQRAPAELVARDQERHAQLTGVIQQLETQITQLQ